MSVVNLNALGYKKGETPERADAPLATIGPFGYNSSNQSSLFLTGNVTPPSERPPTRELH